ncbi:MAG TPA: homoprotocatechuate degradation operon regulator HpaR [Steroidobacteraceae bacterium]|nr:homoprotocatechuate degradation operon regulator HpaR [Steroidobacteraceae bacterium]
MASSKTGEFVHRNLPLLLLQAREQVMARFRPILNDHGITEQQWRVVRVLLGRDALEPREIGSLCRISSPSLAGILARMQELGFIDRRRFDRDQRRVRVTLTRKSRALAARMAPKIEASYRKIEKQLGPQFCDGVYRTLDALITALDQRRPQRLPLDAGRIDPQRLDRRAGAGLGGPDADQGLSRPGESRGTASAQPKYELTSSVAA